MPAKLSTHVLDTMNGCPASGMLIELWINSGGARKLLVSTRTNADGRTEKPLLNESEMVAGNYELNFFVGDYFKSKSAKLTEPPFLDKVPVHFGIADLQASHHVPLLCSPWSYTTYRGS